MSNPEPSTVEIKIAGRTLTCSPLKPELVAPCQLTVVKILALQGKCGNDAMRAWLEEISHAIGYVFLCAKPNHPELTLAEIEDEVTSEEIAHAINAIRLFSMHSEGTSLIQ